MEKYFFDYLLALLMKEVVMEEGSEGLDVIFNKGTHFEMRFKDVQRGAFSFSYNVFEIKAEAEKMYAEKKITKEELEELEVFQTRVDKMLQTFNHIVELGSWGNVHKMEADLHGMLELTYGRAYYYFENVNFELDYEPNDENPLMDVEGNIESKLITMSQDAAKKLREDMELIKEKWRIAMKHLETEAVSNLMEYHKNFVAGDQNGEVCYVNQDGTKQLIENFRLDFDKKGNPLSDEAKADIQMMRDIASLIIAQ